MRHGSAIEEAVREAILFAVDDAEVDHHWYYYGKPLGIPFEDFEEAWQTAEISVNWG